jgi:hypothetical protein
MTVEREGRFSTAGEASGFAAGLHEASTIDPLNKKFIRRNLKPYKNLRKFSTKKGLRGLRGKNTQQLENLAARAVLLKHKVKSKPLTTKVRQGKGKGKHTGRSLRKARRKLRNIDDSFRPGSTKSISNKKIRRAANHLRQLRRNRRVNRTRVGSPKAYDIYKGYRRR